MLPKCIAEDGPSAIRYPRGEEPYKPKGLVIDPEKPYTLYGDKEGDVLIVTYGRISANAFKALERLKSEGKTGAVLMLCRIKPLDKLYARLAEKYKPIFFFEEGIRHGGMGESFLDLLVSEGCDKPYILKAIDDSFVTHASVDRLLQILELDADGIYKNVTENI